MKQGRSLTELAVELNRQRAAKRDFRLSTDALIIDLDEVSYDNGPVLQPIIELDNATQDRFDINDHAHSQLATYTNIPKAYYDRMRTEQPNLLVESLNTWLRDKHEQRLLRTLDDTARAFMSNAYRVLDNYDFMEAALPPLIKQDCRVESCEVTERRLYLKAITDKLTSKVVGDQVQAGLAISNSEVGSGGLEIAYLVWTLRCGNGMIVEKAFKRYHVGRRHEIEDMVQEVISEKSQRLSDAAIWSMVNDVISAAFDQEVFANIIDRLNGTHENKIVSQDIPKVVEVTRKKLALPESTQVPIMTHLLQGGDLSQYGLLNAITRASQEKAVDYELAHSMEVAGGKVMELTPSDWQSISEAA